MKKYLKTIVIVLGIVILGTGISIPLMASAADETELPPEVSATIEYEEVDDAVIAAQEQTKSSKGMSAALVVAAAAACGAIGMALAISKSVEGVARQPEAAGKIQTMLMLGLVFIETAIIYALIVAILIIFVL